MLVEFQVGNFRSFKETVTFSLVAASLSSKDKELDQNTVFAADEQLSLLTSAVVYGANASGKSNLIAALRFMRRFVIDSSRESQADDPIGVEPFRLSEEMTDQPSFFQVIFYVAQRRYRYGFTVNRTRVVSEWLYHVPTSREAKLFERDIEAIRPASTFKEGREAIIEFTRGNALFLSVLAQFNGEVSQKIVGWFRELNVNSGLDDTAYRRYTIQNLGSNQYKDQIVDFVRKLDLGISDITVEGIDATAANVLKESFGANAVILQKATYPKSDGIMYGGTVYSLSGESVRTMHRKYNSEGQATSWEEFDMDQHESEGTKKLFAFAGPIIDTLRTGKILVVDELDARLHPLMTRAIIALFNSVETNPYHGQLIFTTHDTNLLSNKVFRRDQIWFTEKDRKGVTHLYSLAEFKVRNDASFEKDYIAGRYGAIPFIDELTHLVSEDSSE